MDHSIISSFKEKPKTKTAWWAMGLGLGTLFGSPIFLGVFAVVVRPLIDKASSETFGATIGFCVGIAALALSLSALVVGIRAYQKGERSWVMWVGFIPALFVAAFFVFLVLGELFFQH